MYSSVWVSCTWLPGIWTVQPKGSVLPQPLVKPAVASAGAGYIFSGWENPSWLLRTDVHPLWGVRKMTSKRSLLEIFNVSLTVGYGQCFVSWNPLLSPEMLWNGTGAERGVVGGVGALFAVFNNIITKALSTSFVMVKIHRHTYRMSNVWTSQYQN